MNDNEVDAVYSGVRDVFILTIPDYMRKFIQIYYGIHLYDYIWLTMCLSGKQNFVKLLWGCNEFWWQNNFVLCEDRLSVADVISTK